MTTQPTALRLADDLDDIGIPTGNEAAAELRRLHEDNEFNYEACVMWAKQFGAQVERIAALEAALRLAVEALEYADPEKNYKRVQLALATAKQIFGGKA